MSLPGDPQVTWGDDCRQVGTGMGGSHPTLLALGFSHPGLQKVTRPHGNAALVKSHPAREKSPGLC